MTKNVAMESTAHTWSAWRHANYRFFEKYLSHESADRVLVDLGAGDLQFEKLFTRFAYTGVDFQKFPNVSVVTDLTRKIPLPDASADIVTMSNTAEHIPNTEHLFSECKRLLKPGGQLIGTIPFLVQVHQHPYDFNRYTSFQLTRFLELAGFSDIEVVPLGSLIDVYDSIELKFFDHAQAAAPGSPFLWIARKLRRGIMKLLLKPLLKNLPSNGTFTEGFGFQARV